MRTPLAALATLLLPLLFLSAFSPTAPAHAATGIHVSGTKILEANGQEFVMRGTSHAHTWYPTQTKAFADIKSLGANTVRVVLSGGRWTANGVSDVADVVARCKANRLICVLENHDTTGYGEQSGAYTLDQAADYWISVKSALVGQENYVIVNLGNEPVGNNAVTPDWTTATANAVKKLRANGNVVQPVTVTNTSGAAKTSWTVTFTLPAGHVLTGSWNAAVTVSGQTVTARNLSYNGGLGPNASTAFGFQAGRPNGQTAVPSGYTCAN